MKFFAFFEYFHSLSTSARLIIANREYANLAFEEATAVPQTGKVVPVIDRRYPLSEVADALRYYHARGKVIITF
jgi:NADPH:quinone reductase-like Zn-dependent oxidoreductase